DAALAAAQEAAALAPQLGPEGRTWLVRLQAERLRLRWLAGVDADRESLEDLWRRAVEGFGAYGEVYERARSQVRLAQVLLTSGRRQDAVSLVEDATATARRLGAQPLLDEAAALVPLRPDVRAEAQAVALTPREREVLSLVAEGRTNGEVAARLFISTKTASVHVSHILAKLGASSRTEAAAVARRDGLL
ncbi:response regulator transcription factor, partial [Aeromicrobium sp. CnD17-E]